MTAPFRLTLFAGAVLFAAAPFALAESPMPDPIAPAVLGRPVDLIRPVHAAKPKAAVAKPRRTQRIATATMGAPARPALRLTAAPTLAPPQPVAAAAATAVPVAAAVPAAPTAPHAAKQALDDRFDPNARLADDVGKGTRLASKPLPPGAYFSSRTQAMLRNYYAAHPVSGKSAGWKIGEPVPPKAVMTGVPDDVRAALPRLPPGHQYVQLDGEVVLVALPSRMVVDGVSRGGS
jgi:hypothetical protein